MSLSKKDFYSKFLYGFNNNFVKWKLIPLDNLEEEKEDKEEKKGSLKNIELEILFTYNKNTGIIKLTGNQITQVLGYPSSSLIFNSKDIQNIDKINSTYKFLVKSSPYEWEMTLSNRGVVVQEELKNENTGNIEKNKLLSSK